MNRAGLLNFWYYDDEIFPFSDGKLLLRGSNGSGKSVTMQSFLPVLLDGKTSSDRLDPFGTKARRMEDYLLGEKEIVNRDERTGYLFIEYKREDTNQYITTGIGLQARRHKKMNFWGFVITDNRRIDIDFKLYEHEYNNGEKQKIPLSRIQLENRIDTGGQVVRTRREYRDLVNKYIFGFESAEAYEDLIKLLIQLRSPKLSKDFRPTVIYDILEAALPPLTDEDLRHLSDTIEHMDQTKQQIEQLDREQEALQKVVSRYDDYNAYRLVDISHDYLDMTKKLNKETQIIQDKTNEQTQLKQEISSLSERYRALEQSSTILNKKKERLQNHKVWNLEEERANEVKVLVETQADFKKKDQSLLTKKRRELQMNEQHDQLEADIATNLSMQTDLLIDMENDANEASLLEHSINVEDFKRHQLTSHDFSVWEKETEKHYHKLDTISQRLREFERVKQDITERDKKIAETRLLIDQTKQEESDWKDIFEKDKQDKLSDIHAWTNQHPFFSVNEELLQQTSRDMYRLYEPTPFETIRQAFLTVNTNYQMGINESIATKNSQVTEMNRELQNKQDELKEMREKKDPEPPYRQMETTRERETLTQKGHIFIPLFEAVEFQDHVPLDQRNYIEAALLDAGLIDALIVDGEIPLKSDRVIRPDPQVMAHTLADYLIPDLNETSPLSAVKVDEVLRSILVDGGRGSKTSLNQIDGTYHIGLLEGCATEIDRVKFIGKTARQRYREEQIELVLLEIEAFEQELKEMRTVIASLQQEKQAADEAMIIFPHDKDLAESFKHIKEKRFQLEQVEKQLIQENLEVQRAHDVYQRIKRALDVETSQMNIHYSAEAYQEAKYITRRYEKDLSHLKTMHVTFINHHNNLDQGKAHLEELIVEIDELQGELNILKDKSEQMNKNIAEIDEQLTLHGVSDIRKQIQTVQSELQATEDEMSENRITLPRRESALGVLSDQLKVHEHKLEFLTYMIDLVEETFLAEMNYGFVDLSEEIESKDQQARWIVKTYADKLKSKDSGRIEGRLTNIYFEQHSNLMEYRMSDTTTPLTTYSWMKQEWTEEQLIILNNWKQKSVRRLIELEFQGKRVSPYYIQTIVENDRMSQQTMLNNQDRKLYEEILFQSIGRKLRSRIYRAQQWTQKMNALMENSDSSSGLSFSIRWKPRTAETEAELDTKELVDLLRQDPGLLREDDLNQVIEHFRSKINRAKELIELQGEGETLLQVLKEVLDYRYWFSFVLSYQREGEPKRELTNNAFYRFSGGEKAMAMYIPLFTACYSRYLEADEAAPFIISLDEAFAGVDEDNISVMFRIVEELGFDYIMNSQVLWGDYSTVSSLSVCELIRPKNASFVSVIRYHWDGNVRTILDGNN